MKTGTVKFFKEDRGFGFIVDDDTKQEIFVHATGCKSKKVRKGDNVRFDVEPGKNGEQAVNVEVLNVR